MSIELTNEEKLSIVNQHIKSVDYSIYGLQLDLLELNATSNPDASQVANLTIRVNAAIAKREALVTEKNSLITETE